MVNKMQKILQESIDSKPQHLPSKTPIKIQHPNLDITPNPAKKKP